ncbi:hypothetical protein [Paenibacillus sinopodophylli]|uniref:hypothetical protein n=1 Tax=Paenibacillus sinopodophylli TaxID=1837342 RepID=UPI00110D0F43|nr:hypothetical protein [Paenibacillus sinopodophylli]
MPTPLLKPGNLITPLSGCFPVFKKRSLSLSGNNFPLSELPHFKVKTSATVVGEVMVVIALSLTT